MRHSGLFVEAIQLLGYSSVDFDDRQAGLGSLERSYVIEPGHRQIVCDQAREEEVDAIGMTLTINAGSLQLVFTDRGWFDRSTQEYVRLYCR